jgi:hypothetical protein
MGLTRFLGALRVELVQGQNAAAVDLFDPIHARNVLAAFGRAFGRLPESEPERDAFLDQAVAGLAQDGWVISIRLALFAEMIKGKPWTTATLDQAGGMEGIGVGFLEETFRAPALRGREKAAQAVLEALLPEHGTDIKGHMRSFDDLRAAAGDRAGDEDFAGLLKVLDREFRLITPTDPAGLDAAAPAGQYYQLTHDYVVPALREWLARELRKTRRGRARLLLAERAALWSARPENRFLPSAWEWCRIRTLTPPKDWSGPQRRMMRAAGRFHGLRTLGLLVVAAGLVFAGLAVRGRVIEDQQKAHAVELVERLLRVDTPAVPAIVTAMHDERYRRWADRDLKQRFAGLPEGSREKLHASLALLPDPGQAEYLYLRLLNASPTELPVIGQLLRQPHQEDVERFWPVLDNPQADKDQRFRAACALAGSGASAETRRWDAVAPLVADRMLASVLKNPSHYDPLMKSLRPVRQRLIAPLARTFRDLGRPESERALATSILADYAGDQPGVLADLLMGAAPEPFAVLFPKVQSQASRAVAVLEAELGKTTAEDPENLARRQARAAVALLRLGHAEDAWPLLRHSKDPSVRSYMIHWLKPLGADPRVLAAKLEGLGREPRPSVAQTAGSGDPRRTELVLHELGPLEMSRMGVLMEQYRDTPMDLADASLVATAESLGRTLIFTLDHHFRIYRIGESRTFELVP